MSRGMTRSERLSEMERLYQQRGYTDIEMAKRIGVTRATAYKDRILLETEVPFIKDEHGRWYIDRNKYVSAVRVNLNEALALYLATRRASRQTRIAQPHVANALSKLAVTLKKPMTERLVHAADAVLSQKSLPERLAVVETVAQAWVDNIKVRLVYKALDARHATTHVVRPYLIEPSLWSESTYLIAHSDQANKIIPFKLARIERASLTTESFEPPADFDEQQLLRHAWGIWYSDKPAEPVTLRFKRGKATQRLQETIWHPNETVTAERNGDLIWSAEVAEWQEMLPWIRGWGADCEVLDPPELRQTLMGEARAMAEQYGWAISSERSATAPHTMLDDFFGG